MKFEVAIIQEWEGDIYGEILITPRRISFLGDIDQQTGTIVGSDHDIQGETIKDKIFIFPEGRGSTVGSNVIYGLAKQGFAPKLLVTHRAELITISGAVYGQIPMASQLSLDAFKLLRIGDIAKAYIQDERGYLECID
jgi:predicted aconitase with swiveling domain